MVDRLTFRSLILAGVLAVAWVTAARADCEPTAMFTKGLADKYHEAPIVTALQGDYPIVVFASEGGRTFTVAVVVQAGKTMCTLSAGTDWQPAPPPLPGRPS